MSSSSAIEWTDATWNPVTGCSKVSQGCKHCYAERLAPRVFAGQTVPDGLAGGGLDGSELRAVTRPRKFTDVLCHDDRLDAPLRWRKPRRVFVNSMSDLFHEHVTDHFIDQVLAVIGHCSRSWNRCLTRDCDHEAGCERLAEMPVHTFQILTKRPQRMRDYFMSRSRFAQIREAWNYLGWHFGGSNPIDIATWPFPNLWIGVSCEDQEAADGRVPLLLQTPAAVRFLSCEPLLGPIDLSTLPRPPRFHSSPYGWHNWLPRHLHWVIAGGESGPKARPMHPEWARGIRDQCTAAGVPYFFKQWGEWAPGEVVEDTCSKLRTQCYFDDAWTDCSDDWVTEQDHGPLVYRVGKKAAGRKLDGRTWSEFPT